MKLLGQVFIFFSMVGAAAVVPFLDTVSFLFKSIDPIAVQTSNVSKIFISLIFALFAVGVAQLFIRWNKLRGFAGSIPGHLTALGILGTFVGIFCGLYRFDVNNLNASVPHLLEGMKLAFSTSIAGLTASTCLRVSHSIVVSIYDIQDPFVKIGGGDDEEGSTVVVMPGFREHMVASLIGFHNLKEQLEKIYKVLKDAEKK